MKKVSIFGAILLAVVVMVGFKQQQEEPKLKVELTLREWEEVLQVIDNSTAPHVQVRKIHGTLVGILSKQLPKEEAKK